MTVSRRHNGDEGLAEDLLPLADAERQPSIDYTPVGKVLARLYGEKPLSPRDVEAVLEEARVLAGDDARLKRLIDANARTAPRAKSA